MRRLAAAVVLLVVSVTAFTLPTVASAPSTLQAIDTGVTARFPGSLEFTVAAEGPQPVTDVRLLYRIDKMNYAAVTSESWATVSPSTSVQTSWTWDMRRASLPPGARITYWWQVSDAAGSTVVTPPGEVVFDDDRYEWQQLESDEVTLYWYYGSESFARELLQVCDEAIEALARDLGARVDRRIIVYIYGSAADLRQAMVYPQEWTGGVAFTDYGIVAIGIGPGDMDWGIRALRHELTHLVVHRLTFGPFGGLPTWLDEGLAMRNEGETAGTFRAVLRHAVLDDTLISLRTLNGPFSSETQKAYLSYAQSESVVRYLLGTYGSEPMNRLLLMLTAGETVDFSLRQNYDMGLEDIEAAWLAALRAELSSA